MRRIPPRLVATVIAILTTAPAFAASSASATVGPFAITLYDLNTDDGITPAIYFHSRPYATFAWASANEYQAGLYSYNEIWGNIAWEPISTSAGVPHAKSAASVSGSGTADGTVVSASGSAAGVTLLGHGYSDFQARAWAPYTDTFTFTLSANTLMVGGAGASVAAAVSAGFDPAVTDEYEQADAHAALRAWGPGPLGKGEQSSSDAIGVIAASKAYDDPACPLGYCYGPASASFSRTLSVSFANASSGDMTGYFQSEATVGGWSYTAAPVSEPGSYALMLAGLTALAFVVRRRS
jgi:hypothetical protein